MRRRVCIFAVAVFLIITGSTYSVIEPVSELLQKALDLNKAQKYQESIIVFRKVLRRDTGNLTALQGIGVNYLFLNQNDKSLVYLKKALEKDSNNITTLLSLGKVYENKQIFYMAHFYYSKILKLDPYQIEAFLGEGRVYNQDRQYRTAIKTYQKVLELDPYHVSALLGISFSHRRLGNYLEAIKYAKKILEIEPKETQAMIQIASLYEAMGDKQSAIVWYKKAQALDPKNDKLHAKLSILYSETDQIDAALTELQKVTELQQGNIKNYITLGRAYGWLYRLDESIQVFENARKMDPKNIHVLNDLASVYLLNGDWTESQKIYKEILELNPKNPDALKGLKNLEYYKKPTFSSRFHYTENKDAVNNANDTKDYKIELSEELIHKLSSNFFLEGKAQKIHEYQDDIVDGSKEYNFDQYVAALRFNWKLVDSLTWSSRGEYNYLENKGSNTYNFSKSNFERFSAFSYLFYSQKNYYGLLSYRRALLLRLPTTGSTLKMNPYNEGSLSGGFNITPYLEAFIYYSFTDFVEQKDQHDAEGGITYRLPFLKQVEVGYSFEWLSTPTERIHSASARLQERLFKTVLFDMLYKYILNNNSTDGGVTYTHSVKTVFAIPLYKQLTFNFEGKLDWENGKDHDFKQRYFFYLEVPLGVF